MASEKTELLGFARDIVVAQITATPRPDSEVPALLESVYGALHRLMNLAVYSPDEHRQLLQPRAPAVPISESITHDYLVCLEDGRRLQLLKRYLQTQYGLTPDMYRERWGLPKNYPMSAPCITEQRRSMAKQNKLGGKIAKRT